MCLRLQAAVLLDPYAQAVLSRRHWGRLAPDHDWEAPGQLGFASTWPQAAAALPVLEDFDWEGGYGTLSFASTWPRATAALPAWGDKLLLGDIAHATG